MQRHFLFLGILSLVVISVLIYGFTLVGTPFDAALRSQDKNILQNIVTTASGIFSYYRTFQTLPMSLSDLPQTTSLTDNLKSPEYKKTSSTTFELCTDFKSSNTIKKNEKEITYTEVNVYQISYDTYPVKKGQACIKFAVTPNGEIGISPVSKAPVESLFEDFENWKDAKYPQDWNLLSGNINRTTKAYSKQYALEFPIGSGETQLTSPELNISTNRNMAVSFMYDTSSTCKDCLFAGYKIFDKNSKEISTEVSGCGTYNPFTRLWQQYITGPTKGYELTKFSCTLPVNTATYQVVVGIGNQSQETWSIDYLYVAPVKIERYPSESNTARECPTALVNGECQLNNCSYTYPSDIYTKGKVVVGDYYRNIGQATGTFYDECTPNGKQVVKMECSGNPKDPYNLGKANYNCPNGCANGACLR